LYPVGKWESLPSSYESAPEELTCQLIDSGERYEAPPGQHS